MKSLRVHWIATLVGIMCAAAPGMAAERPAILEVRVKDHREAIGDFSKLIVTLDEILISPKPGYVFWRGGWKSLTPSLASFDLTRYTGAHSAVVFRGPVGAGSFDAIHLKIKALQATLKRTGASAQLKNSVAPIKLAFATSSAGETVVVMDLVVLDLSDHAPQAYELGVRGYELYNNGKLTDKIPPG